MERRITRSAARQAALLTPHRQDAKQSLASKANDVTAPKSRRSTLKNDTNETNPAKTEQSSGTDIEPPPKKRGKTVRGNKRCIMKTADLAELPHNLGATLPALKSEDDDPSKPHSATKKQSPPLKEEEVGKLADQLQHRVDKATTAPPPSANGSATEKPEKTKKAKKATSYGLTPGITPFPDWAHPTPEECEEVNALLSSVHGEIAAPAQIPEPSLTVTGCGEVPSVLDALIRTLLSGATSGNNSAMAFGGLVQKFGILDHGIGKGSVNWEAVRQAPLKDVFEAIKSGGLADNKSKNIKAILDMVHAENQDRRNVLFQGADPNSATPPPDDLLFKSEGGKQYEIACADQNFLSLNHLHHLSTESVMTSLMKYPGIGPKTAACVALFCLQRPCFAVDTHIFRICKWLRWVPPTKATEITAFSHLEVRIPDHLKYSLHQLFIRHGKSCPRCRAITGQGTAGWEDGCVIEHLVTRTGKRKGG